MTRFYLKQLTVCGFISVSMAMSACSDTLAGGPLESSGVVGDFGKPVIMADAQSSIGQRYDSYRSELPRRSIERELQAENSFVSTGVISEPPMQEYRPYSPNVPAYTIQAGAFYSYDNASRLALLLSGFGQTRIDEDFYYGKTIYRVQLGGWVNREQAQPMLDLIQDRGFEGFITEAS